MTCCGATCVAVEIRGVYDGALYYECPRCVRCYHRFPPGTALRELAQAWADRHGFLFSDAPDAEPTREQADGYSEPAGASDAVEALRRMKKGRTW